MDIGRAVVPSLCSRKRNRERHRYARVAPVNRRRSRVSSGAGIGRTPGLPRSQSAAEQPRTASPAPRAWLGRFRERRGGGQRHVRLARHPALRAGGFRLRLETASADRRLFLRVGRRDHAENAPYLTTLLRRSFSDIGLATYGAKNYYKRKRPFQLNELPMGVPEYRAQLEKDPSYPSGHTAIGWGFALILSELAPERADELPAIGAAHSERAASSSTTIGTATSYGVAPSARRLWPGFTPTPPFARTWTRPERKSAASAPRAYPNS